MKTHGEGRSDLADIGYRDSEFGVFYLPLPFSVGENGEGDNTEGIIEY